MNINGLKNESIGNTNYSQDSSWEDIINSDFDQNIAKSIEIIPSNTLEISLSLFVDQENKLLTVLRTNINAFTRNYKEIYRVHPSICTNRIYIKEGHKPVR